MYEPMTCFYLKDPLNRFIKCRGGDCVSYLHRGGDCLRGHLFRACPLSREKYPFNQCVESNCQFWEWEDEYLEEGNCSLRVAYATTAAVNKLVRVAAITEKRLSDLEAERASR